MYILLAFLAACALGIGVHYLIPYRELRGVAVTPAIATVASALAYTVMQWAGVGEDSVWLWLVSIIGAVIVAAGATYAIALVRKRTDAAKKVALGI